MTKMQMVVVITVMMIAMVIGERGATWPTGDDCDHVDDDVTTKMKTSMMKLQIMMIMMRTIVMVTMEIR